MRVFGICGSESYAKQVAKNLDMDLAPHVDKNFDDGEGFMRSKDNVRGLDVYVVCSLYSDEKKTAAEKLLSLLFFVGSLKDASAKRITVVSPYLAFARQDRKTESRAPIATKYTAKLMEAAGVDRVISLDVHNLQAFQNAFRIPTDNLEAKNLFVDWLTGMDGEGGSIKSASDDAAELRQKPQDFVFFSPDAGGVNRMRFLRDAAEKRLKIENVLGYAILDKERNTKNGAVRGDKIIGDVDGKKVVIVDDLISTGKTIKLAADAIVRHGGKVHCVLASHGVFTGGAATLLDGMRLVIADTIPPFRLKGSNINVNVVETSSLFAKAINRNHKDGGSISQLLS
jgi:ribose-phosphate pyrophosphokinase